MSVWAIFSDSETFNAWHADICSAKNIPHPGRNAATGEVAILNQWTDAWVDPLEAEDGTIVVLVPDEDAGGLDVINVNTDFDTRVMEIEGGTVLNGGGDVGFNWRKEKPSTYFIDGKTYNTTTGEIIS